MVLHGKQILCLNEASWPWQIDQDRFDSGRYRVRGIYRRTWFDREFVYEGNRYEMSCGDAYLFVRNIERAP